MSAASPFAEFIAASPTLSAEAERHAGQVAERRRTLIDGITKLNAEAELAYPGEEKRKAAAIAARDSARVALQLADAKMIEAHAEVAGARLARETKRRGYEEALLSVDFSAIDGFVRWTVDEADRVRKLVDRIEAVERNERTGRSHIKVVSNSRSIRARCRALLEAAEAARDLRVTVADPREIPARLNALRDALPAVAAAEVKEGDA